MNFTFRKATVGDTEKLENLIEISAKVINATYYSESEINAALGNAWTVDNQLIFDKTYWIAENIDGEIIGCGGWNKRNLLFGKNDYPNSSKNELNPKVEAARIRAFFVHPNFTRKGIGKELLQKYEFEAQESGFKSLKFV